MPYTLSAKSADGTFVQYQWTINPGPAVTVAMLATLIGTIVGVLAVNGGSAEITLTDPSGTQQLDMIKTV